MAEWDKKPGEPAFWYARFHAYLMLGPSRSLLKAYNAERSRKDPDKPRTYALSEGWQKSAVRWKWKKRAEAYDEEERQRVLREAEDRRYKQREREWELSEAMANQALAMAKHPLVTRTIERVVDEQGKEIQQIITVHPTEWVKRDIIPFAETASKLGRRSVGMDGSADVTFSGQVEQTPTDQMAWLKELGVAPPSERGKEKDKSPNGSGNGPTKKSDKDVP
jgi:hypothetical protein